MSSFSALLRKAETQPLSRSLPACLRLALSAGIDELVEWIRLESLGYTRANPAMRPEIVVPEYRAIGGNWFDDYGRPLVLTDPKLAFLNELRLREGAGELESLAGKQGTLGIRSDAAEILKEHLNVEVTMFRFTPHSIEQVLANIRAQLVDRLAANERALAGTPPGPSPSTGGADILLLRPGIYGIGVDLKALWRRLRSRSRD